MGAPLGAVQSENIRVGRVIRRSTISPATSFESFEGVAHGRPASGRSFEILHEMRIFPLCVQVLRDLCKQRGVHRLGLFHGMFGSALALLFAIQDFPKSGPSPFPVCLQTPALYRVCSGYVRTFD